MSDKQSIRLLHAFSTFAVGGAQMRLAVLANAFGTAYEHHIVAMDGRYEAADLFDEGVEVHIHHMPVIKSGFISIQNLKRFRAFMSEVKPDILCTYNFGAIEWAFANRIAPLVPHLHFEDGFGRDEAGGVQIPRRVWARRIGLSGASEIVVPSRVLQTIAEQAWGFSASVHYMPNGVDCDKLSSPENPITFRKRPDEIVIGSIGALRPEKNLSRLLRLFHALGDTSARLVIVGDGGERPALEAEARERGIDERVTFAGYVAEPERALAGFDIFALTSDTEQMPISLIEAMAAGLPVLATNVGDVRDMLPPAQHAYLADVEAEAALTPALKDLIGDAQLRRTLGEGNRAVANARFRRADMTARYDALFRRLAGRSADMR